MKPHSIHLVIDALLFDSYHREGVELLVEDLCIGGGSGHRLKILGLTSGWNAMLSALTPE